MKAVAVFLIGVAVGWVLTRREPEPTLPPADDIWLKQPTYPRLYWWNNS
jgi:hypothetical protein